MHFSCYCVSSRDHGILRFFAFSHINVQGQILFFNFFLGQTHNDVMILTNHIPIMNHLVWHSLDNFPGNSNFRTQITIVRVKRQGQGQSDGFWYLTHPDTIILYMRSFVNISTTIQRYAQITNKTKLLS